MRYNIEAIRTAFRLGVEKRGPSAEEMEVLGRYAGFGGLKCILNDADSLMDAAKWSKSDIELFAPTVELRQLIREYSKDDREFARYMDSLKTSVLTAFYTPSPVVDAIFDTLKTNGVEVRSIWSRVPDRVFSLTRSCEIIPMQRLWRLRKICSRAKSL